MEQAVRGESGTLGVVIGGAGFARSDRFHYACIVELTVYIIHVSS